MKTNRQDLALRQNLLKRKQQMKARHLSLKSAFKEKLWIKCETALNI